MRVKRSQSLISNRSRKHTRRSGIKKKIYQTKKKKKFLLNSCSANHIGGGGEGMEKEDSQREKESYQIQANARRSEEVEKENR